MKEKTEVKNGGGIGFVGCLQILFIALKLCKVIEWSWVWVLAPTWIWISIILLCIIILAFYKAFTE